MNQNFRFLDAWIITSGYREESTAELVGEVVYKSRLKNPEINFNAIAVGKWGNFHDCHELKSRFEIIAFYIKISNIVSS